MAILNTFNSLDENGEIIQRKLNELYTQRREYIFCYIDNLMRSSLNGEDWAVSTFSGVHYDILHALHSIIVWENSRLKTDEVAGKRLLEIGAGRNFALALFYAQHGAEVWVNDKNVHPWIKTYHPVFYKALVHLLPEMTILHPIIENNGFTDALNFCQGHIEACDSLPEEYFDYVISNTVLEHVMHIDLALSKLFKSTRSNGKHIHKIDYRSHYTPGFPLSLLLYDKAKIHEIREFCNGGIGCAWRNAEMVAHIQTAGFKDIQIKYPELLNDERYYDSFLNKLRSSASPYRNWPAADLRILAAVYNFVKVS